MDSQLERQLDAARDVGHKGDHVLGQEIAGQAKLGDVSQIEQGGLRRAEYGRWAESTHKYWRAGNEACQEA